MCSMTHTLRDTLKSNMIKPNKVYDKLKAICKHLVHGRQEDAHEFLRYLAFNSIYDVTHISPYAVLLEKKIIL